MLAIAVEVCSAAYFVDTSMETVIGNAICADGAAAVVLSCAHGDGAEPRRVPEIVAFQFVLDPEQLDKAGFEQRDGKLRIILAAEIRDLAGLIIRPLPERTARAARVAPRRHSLLGPAPGRTQGD